MTLDTQTTDRKGMAKALADHLGTTAKYLGTPSYAFQVGDYTVNRDGSISGDDLEAIRPFLIENGYIEVTPVTEPETEAELIPEATENTDTAADSEETQEYEGRIDVTIPAPDMTPVALRNLFFTVFSKQTLMNHMMGADLISIPETLVSRLQETLPETPDAFTALLQDLKDTDGLTGFDYHDEKVTMSMPQTAEEPRRWEVFAHLLGRMIQTAKAATRVVPEIPEAESEKYMARTWLLRMGYGGQDLKAHRRELLKNLKGPSAFPNSAAAQKHKDKYAELRRQEREMRTGQPADSEVTVTVTEGSEEAAE